MTENTQQANNQEQANETQDRAERFTWKEGEVKITLPQDQEPEAEMEQAEDETSKPVHHQTKRGADMSLAKREISQASHKAVLEGRISLAEARDLGRSAGPDGPAGSSAKKSTGKKVSKKDRSRLCACGCENLTRGGVWIPGHDARLPGLVLQAVRGEIELTDEQKEHAEKRDLFAKAEAKIAAQKAKEEAKAQKQAEREAAKKK